MILTAKNDVPLLEFLLSEMHGVSRTKIKSLLKYGQISVDGIRVTAFDFPLHSGNSVSIKKDTKIAASKRSLIDIIFEDDSIIVINKPQGMLSVPPSDEGGITAFELVSDYVRAVDSRKKAHVVHRLDKDTSGLLLFAKNERIKKLLQENWNDIVTERRYYAVVEGRPQKAQDVITSWLSEGGHQVSSSRVQVPDSKRAVTRYTVLRESNGYSLLDVSIETGRKNQIRVHMQSIGCPVAGDKKYGAKTNPLHRLGLHSYRLELSHPTLGDKKFKCNPPRSFMRLLKLSDKSK